MPVPKNWKAKGEKSEAAITHAFVAADIPVLTPVFQQNLRFDMVIERDKLERVQCKTGKLSDGVITFATSSSSYQYTTTHGVRYGKKNYEGQADLFAVYCPQNQKTYLVPVAEAPKTSCSLRVDPPKNSAKHKIRFAKNYELAPKQEELTETKIPYALLDFKCKVCGKPVGNRRSYYCSASCTEVDVHKKNGTSKRPERDQLVRDITTMTWVAIGKKYDVSDNAARKWAKFYGLL